MTTCALALITALTANAAELMVSIQTNETGNDTVELIAEHEGLDLKWISGYVLNENGTPVYIGEERPNDTLKFQFTPEEEKTRHYKAYVNLISKDDSIVKLEKEFVYYTYEEVKRAMKEALSGEKTLAELKEVLSLQFNGIYESVGSEKPIVDEMNKILADNENIEHSDFLEAFNTAVVRAALKNKNEATVKYILENCRDIVGITEELREKKWYDEFDNKNDVITAIAKEAYENENAFLQSFRINVFLKKLSKEHSSTLIDFLRKNSNGYYTQDSKPFVLDFDKFDRELTTSAKKEYAGLLLSSYDKSAPDKLKKSFDDAIENAKNYTPSNGGGSGSNSGNSSGGGGGYSYSVPVPENNNTKTVFDDIESVKWAEKEIEYCVEKGIIKGKTEGKFCPNDNITREEFTAIIVRALKLTASGKVEFDDVDKNAWYYDSINAAAENGIVMGQGNVFGIGSNITRQDMAVIMYRIAEKNEYDLSPKSDRSLSDLNTASEYARNAIESLYKAEYINGVDEGIYAPLSNATRAQAVKIIYNLINR